MLTIILILYSTFFFGQSSNTPPRLLHKNIIKSLSVGQLYSITEDEIKVDTLNSAQLLLVAKKYYEVGNYKYFVKYSRNVYSRNKKYQNEIAARASSYLCTYFEEVEELDSAFFYCDIAEKRYQNLKNQKMVLKLLNKKAYIQYYAQDYLGSDYSAAQALSLSIELKNRDQQYIALSILGSNAIQLQEFERGLKYHQKALLTIRKYSVINDSDKRIMTLNNIANTYEEMGRFDKAIKLYRFILKTPNLSSKSPEIFPLLLDNLANSLLKKGTKSAEIKTLLVRASKLSTSHNHKVFATINLHLSQYFLKNKDTLKAAHYGEIALSNASEHRLSYEQILILRHLATFKSNMSVEYLERSIKLSDSLILAKRLIGNNFARIKFETKQIASEKQIAIREKWIITIISSVAVLMMFLLLLIIRERSKRKQIKLVANQNTANQELYTLMLQHQDSVQEGRTRERRRIARDLHDGVMNGLASTRIQLFEMARRFQDSKVLAKYAEGIQNIETEIRNISHDLTAETFKNDEEFKILLKELFSGQMRDGGFKFHVQYNSDINWEFLSSTHKVNLYRIFQEIMQNAVKHSHASLVTVTPKLHAKKLIIEVVDNGLGFESLEVVGFGLQNIRDRLASMRGKLEISNLRGGGAKYKMLITL